MSIVKFSTRPSAPGLSKWRSRLWAESAQIAETREWYFDGSWIILMIGPYNLYQGFTEMSQTTWKKKLWKNSNYDLSSGYQHLPDHDGGEGNHGMEAGDPCNWDISKLLFLRGLDDHKRSERGLGIRNEKNEWGGNVHVSRRGGGEFLWSVCPLGLYLLPAAWT